MGKMRDGEDEGEGTRKMKERGWGKMRERG